MPGRRRQDRLVDRFAVQAAACDGLANLQTLLAATCDELGFSHFALLHHASLTSDRQDLVRLDNYPSAWASELCQGLAGNDPVHEASRRMATGFAWSDLGRIIPLNTAHRKILHRSRDHGVGPGFTVPVNIPGEPSGSCSFAVRAGRLLPRARLRCAESIGAHAFQAARRLCGHAHDKPRLSPRELQCVRLVALGKTDWEIATILAIGPETVRTYVKHARSIYGVATRTQLAVHALRDNQISFDEATGDGLV